MTFLKLLGYLEDLPLEEIDYGYSYIVFNMLASSSHKVTEEEAKELVTRIYRSVAGCTPAVKRYLYDNWPDGKPVVEDVPLFGTGDGVEPAEE